MFLARLSRNQPYVLQDVMRDFVQSRQSIPNEVQIECSTHQLGSVVRKQVSLTINETRLDSSITDCEVFIPGVQVMKYFVEIVILTEDMAEEYAFTYKIT